MADDQDQLQVRVTASIDDLISKMQQSTAALQDSFSKIEQSVGRVSDSMKGGLSDSFSRVSDSMKSLGASTGGVGAALESISSKFQALGAATGIGLAVAGMMKLNDQILQAGENARSIINLSSAFQITTTQLQGLEAIAERTGVPIEQLRMAMTRTQQMMQLAAEGNQHLRDTFGDLGISLTDILNPNFSVLDAMVRIGQQTDKNREIMSLYGRNAAGIVTVLQALKGGLAGVDDAATGVGAQTNTQLESLKDYAGKVDELKRSWGNLTATWSADTLPVMGKIVDALKSMTDAARDFHPFDAIAEGWEHAKGIFSNIGQGGPGGAFGLATQLGMAGTGAGPAAGTEAKNPPVAPYKFDSVDQTKTEQARLEAAHESATEEISLRKQALDDQLKNNEIGIAEFATQDKALIAEKLAADIAYYTQKKALDEKSAQDSLKKSLDDLRAEETNEVNGANGNEAQIASIHARYAAQRKALEASVMADVIKDEQEITKAKAEAAKQGMEVEQQVAEQTRKLAMESATDQRDAALRTLEAKRAALKDELKEKQITGAAFLAADAALIAQMKAAWEAFYAYKASLDSHNAALIKQDEAALAKAIGSLSKEQQADQFVVADQIAKKWQDVSKTIASALTNGFMSVLKGTQTFGGAMRNVAEQLAGDWIKSILEVEIQHVASEAVKRAQSMFTSTLIKTQNTTDAATALTESGLTSMAEVANAASVAAANAFASTAAIPYVGPILAPEAAATAYAAVMAFEAGIMSAASGYDVPSNVNPLTQLHAKEMVLPASLAEGVRAMTAQAATRGTTSVAAGSSSAAAGAGSVSINLKAQQYGDLLLLSHDDLADAINTLVRRRGGSNVF